jgi:biotin carboxyl carrier protein
MSKVYKVNVENSSNYDFNKTDIDNLDILKITKSKFHVLNNNKSFKVNIEESNFNTKSYIINVNSNNYKVQISNELDILIEKMGFSLGSSRIENIIKAPMPGLILNVNVSEGQKVKEGEILVILEAMKMENTITSPNEGIIKSIYVENGKTVEKGEILIELE